MPSPATMNLLLGTWTSILQGVIIIVLILALLTPSKDKNNKKKRFPQLVTHVISKHALLLVFLASLASVLGSLYYSEIAGYEPCKLCWIQRIFLYPQAIITFIALIKKDRKALHYTLVLSTFAAAVAAYHYSGQIGLSDLACDATGVGVKCSTRFMMTFGYITIPMMSLTIAISNILLSFIGICKYNPVDSKNK